VVLAHNASIEQSFINSACKKCFACQPPLRIVDTLKIEQRRLTRRHQHPATNQLRLFNLRHQYHLPRYNAHNALEDALATAELFLAMAHTHCHDLDNCKLKEFL
jgi:DNA polymerase-3 subunit epsilon